MDDSGLVSYLSHRYAIRLLYIWMKAIIAGSRDLSIGYDKIWLVADAVTKSGWLYEISEIVSGGCRGIDLAGEMYAEANPTGRVIPIKRFLPDWTREGKGAGPIRNSLMAEYADAFILIWDGRSRGSADMLKKAEAKKLKIYQYLVT
jgi:hypothetical protein